MTADQEPPRRTGRFAQAAAEEFRLLVESVKDYAIFLLDRDGHVMSWNAGAERIKGHPAEEVLGHHFSRFYEPEDRASGRPAKALEVAARDGRFEGYGWRVRRDGSRFFAHVIITALYDQQGNLHGFAKVTQDITTQREAERLLREREQQLAEAQAIAQLGSFEWDVATDRITWSPELCRIYGLEPRTHTSTFQEFAAHIHPDDRPLVEIAIQQTASTGGPFRVEQRIIRPNGETRLLLCQGRVIPDAPGRPYRVIGVCQDVTEQREGERLLAEANAQTELSYRLQSALLPALSLRDPHLSLRTRYLPGHERALLGADFFDALELPDGRVAVLIGDVAGHGPAEAAVGVALRAAWRALILAGHGHTDVLDGLDRVLVSNRLSEEMFATVCCLGISADRHEITVALAGHPPPLLAADGKVAAVEVAAGPALGVLEHEVPWRADTLHVGDAWALLCYTDGLIEGRQAPDSVERFGVEALSAAATRLLEAQGSKDAFDADALLDGLLDSVLDANGQQLSDDVAMLYLASSAEPAKETEPGGTDALQGDLYMPATAQRLDLPPDPPSAMEARRFIRQFAVSNCLPDELAERLVLIGSELVTNAVVHARTALTLTVELLPDVVRVAVTDRSSAPATVRRYGSEALTGRGLAVVRAISHRWGVDTVGVGKRVWAELHRTSRGPAAANGHHRPWPATFDAGYASGHGLSPAAARTPRRTGQASRGRERP